MNLRVANRGDRPHPNRVILDMAQHEYELLMELVDYGVEDVVEFATKAPGDFKPGTIKGFVTKLRKELK